MTPALTSLAGVPGAKPFLLVTMGRRFAKKFK
jgi:hypothetical protein